MNSSLSKNPLSSFMRQPKIFIKLPSNGQYWPEHSIEIPENNEFPVYSMTAQDELMLKIPDALMNGQAVVDVIQNCMPNIKNAWDTPAIDLEIILISIRLATYGHDLNIPVKLENDVEFEYKVDLRNVLDNLLNQITWDPHVIVNDDLTIYVKPINYKKISEFAIKSFETQKIMQLVNDEKMSDDEKISIFKESFKKLSDATIGTIAASVYKIDSSQGSTDDKQYIDEFLINIDKEIFKKIENHLENLKNINSVKPITVKVTEDLKMQGVKEDTIEIPLIFDASNFFV